MTLLALVSEVQHINNYLEGLKDNQKLLQHFYIQLPEFQRMNGNFESLKQHKKQQLGGFNNTYSFNFRRFNTQMARIKNNFAVVALLYLPEQPCGDYFTYPTLRASISEGLKDH